MHSSAEIISKKANASKAGHKHKRAPSIILLLNAALCLLKKLKLQYLTKDQR